jgi:uncharacterized membrane protein YsdA (DUF1294 family)/cold shock CspA family protein
MTRGVVVTFDDERGFGFLRSRDFAEDVFVHVTAVVGRQPLRAGQRVRFTAEAAQRGPRAVRVEPGRFGLPPAWAAGLGLGAAQVLGTLGLHQAGLPWALAWLGAINPVAFLVYGWDKRRALWDRRRVPEGVLLGLALVGGSPMSALAMAAFRHKTRKGPFLWGFVGVVVLQVLVLAFLFLR